MTTTTSEKDLGPVAEKLLDGNGTGAVEELAELLVGVVTGHPIVGTIGGRMAKMLALGLANGFVEAATQRMLEADKQWEDAEAQAAWLRKQMAASVEPLLTDRDDRDDERFLQTLRYIERTVASAAAMDEVLEEIRSLAGSLHGGMKPASGPGRPAGATPDPSPRIAENAIKVASSLEPKELREWMVRVLSPEELELFVADALPESGGLRRIVSGLHPHEYQVFKVVEFCQRRGFYQRLQERLVNAFGVPATDGRSSS